MERMLGRVQLKRVRRHDIRIQGIIARRLHLQHRLELFQPFVVLVTMAATPHDDEQDHKGSARQKLAVETDNNTDEPCRKEIYM